MAVLSLSELVLRLGLALFIGLVLGIEREQHGRAAGMRTTMLVCVAAAVVMLLSQHIYVVSGEHPDPARLAAGVLTGMGFLGAGVIIQQNHTVYGVTTAAVLWFSAILGMAFGAGHYSLGFLGFAIVLVALLILPHAERWIQSERYARLEVLTRLSGPSQEQILQASRSLGLPLKLRPVGLEHDSAKLRRSMRFEVQTKNQSVQQVQTALVTQVAALKGVIKVTWS